MKQSTLRVVAGTTLVLALITAPAHAIGAGDWIVRAGATGVYPETTDSGTVSTAATGPIPGTAVGPGDAWSLGLTIGYAFDPNWGIELLLAWPFPHDIEANDGLRAALQGAGLSGTEVIGEIEQLPPTLSLNYTFQPGSRIRPYVGAGINWFYTFNEEVKGDLATAGYTDLDVDNSFGVALQAGIDFDVTDRVFLNASVRWIDIDVDAKVTGGALGDIEVSDIKVDPWIYSIMLGTTF